MGDAKLRSEVDAILRRNITAGGASVAIASSQTEPLCFHTGLADIKQSKPVEATHLFGIGSITKVFVAVLVLQLVEEGKLGLQDTVQEHLHPDTYRDIDDAGPASISQLLNHTSGIDSWEDDPIWLVDARGARLQLDRIWQKTEPLDYIRRPKKTAPGPGTWSYANTNYTLLGLIVENITGNSAESEIRRRILQPLDLKLTFLDGFESCPEGGTVASRYHYASQHFRNTAGICNAFPLVREDIMNVTGSNLSVSWMAGGMISHPLDLVKFALALNTGRLLKPSSMALMHDFVPSTLPDHEMGRGVFRQTIPGQGAWIGHSGGVLGFSAQLWWREDGDCVVCVLANVGTVNAGKVDFGTSPIVQRSNFLGLAYNLVKG
ncbi:hypothetical protein CKM354_000672600 [Cercospora kikuchii]|uniref:Beta-lactamase-related domain-containing protein n=1 Tax=Cercospora kikuchii TaxID=84275 RepID=A0A9P3FDL4_9PEZI|nr:uncharacterized protein CKM354_000672600 [Cercospora kikuchii]GIZ43501.1 hypothetical protein CKM354_000672600 [Cercospora kikuchii]